MRILSWHCIGGGRLKIGRTQDYKKPGGSGYLPPPLEKFRCSKVASEAILGQKLTTTSMGKSLLHKFIPCKAWGIDWVQVYISLIFCKDERIESQLYIFFMSMGVVRKVRIAHKTILPLFESRLKKIERHSLVFDLLLLSLSELLVSIVCGLHL